MFKKNVSKTQGPTLKEEAGASEPPLEGHVTFQLSLPRGADCRECMDSGVAVQNQSYSFTCLVNKWQRPMFVCGS